MQSFYIGPHQQRLRLASWADAERASTDGLFNEHQWTECKWDVPSGRDETFELARDLASFGVDGGTLLIGVGDRKKNVVGHKASLRGRIADVAVGTIRPALNVVIEELRHPSDEAKLLTIVHIPPSADAPHMVDHNYWARSATGKRKLDDPELSRLMADRRFRKDDFQARLTTMESTLDPTAVDDRQQGHVYILIEPTTSISPANGDWLHSKTIIDFIGAALGIQSSLGPEFRYLTYNVPHQFGVAGMNTAVNDRGREEDRLFALITDSGAVHVIAGCGTRSDEPLKPGGPARKLIFARQLITLTHRALAMAANISVGHLSYGGGWRIGVYVNQLAGGQPVRDRREFQGFEEPVAFAGDVYLEVVEFPTFESGSEAGNAIVARLWRRLLRGLGQEQKTEAYCDINNLE